MPNETHKSNGMRLKTCFAAALLIIAAAAISGAADFDYGADLRQNTLIFKRGNSMPVMLMPDRIIGLSQTALRVNGDVYFEDFTISGALENKSTFLSTDQGFGGIMGGQGGGFFGSSKPLRIQDETFHHISEDNATMQTSIERLDVSWYMGAWTFDVGRQPVSIGTSHLVGVLDVIAPFSPGDLDATYKPGVDAVRIRRGIGMTGEAEIIAVGDDNMDNGAILTRGRGSFGGIDIEGIFGRFRQRNFGGIGWEGGLGEWGGIWGETALFQHRDGEEQIYGGSEDVAFSGVAGLDYELPWDMRGGTSFMYQDFGYRDTDDLFNVYNDAPFREGWAFLAANRYGVQTLHRELHPLVQGDLAGIINLVDYSTLWQPRLTVSVGDNSDISFYGWLSSGEKTDIAVPVQGQQGAPLIDPGSEFGMIPQGGGMYARWFF
jgi:hypothetical protein